MKRINAIMGHVLAARREALSLKIKDDRQRVLRGLEEVLGQLKLIESGLLNDGEDERAAKRRRFE